MSENNSRPYEAAFDRLLALMDLVRRRVELRLQVDEHSMSELRVIRTLRAADSATDSQARASIGMPSPQFSRVRKSLVAQGLIRLAPYQRHKSQSLLSLTEAGRLAADEAQAERAGIFDEELKRLTDAERRMIYNAVSGPKLVPDADRPRPRIVPAGIADIDRLLTVVQAFARELELGEGFVLEVAERLVNLLRNTNTEWVFAWVALVGDQFVGAAILEENVGLEAFADMDDRAKLRLLFVNKHYRGKQIGRGLLTACVNQATMHEEDAIFAMMPASRKNAVSFLKQANFRQEGKSTHRDDYGLMEKWSDFRLSLTK